MEKEEKKKRWLQFASDTYQLAQQTPFIHHNFFVVGLDVPLILVSLRYGGEKKKHKGGNKLEIHENNHKNQSEKN